MLFRTRLHALFIAAVTWSFPAHAATVLDETTLVLDGTGETLSLRHRAQSGKTDYAANDVVLFLEPYSVPAAAAFDLPGYSWMEHLAERGYDTWALDFRGFGRSSRPAEMALPPQDNRPVIRSAEAMVDLAAAIAHIRTLRHVDKITLVGWSYGSVIAGKYAAEKPNEVGKLVLLGAMHAFSLPSMTKPFENKDRPGELDPALPAYQIITPDAALHHWHMMAMGIDVMTADAFSTVRTAIAGSDPTTDQRTPPAIRRPIGPLVDLFEIWNNRPLYDAAKIQAPTLVIYGQQDFFAEVGLAKKLSGSVAATEVSIPAATHWVLYEKGRTRLLEETDRFLSK